MKLRPLSKKFFVGLAGATLALPTLAACGIDDQEVNRFVSQLEMRGFETPTHTGEGNGAYAYFDAGVLCDNGGEARIVVKADRGDGTIDYFPETGRMVKDVTVEKLRDRSADIDFGYCLGS